MRPIALAALLLGVAACGAGEESVGSGDQEIVREGSWRTTTTNHMTEHAALMPNGRVFLWGLAGDTRPAVFDPSNDTLRRIPGPRPDGNVLHNSGHVLLPDGRLLMIGGGIKQKTARTYDVSAPAGITPWGMLGGGLTHARFYPTVVVLGSGAVLVASGDYLTGPDPGAGPSFGLDAELYDPAQDRWVPIVDRSQRNERLPSADLYPHMHLLPSGRIVTLTVANDFSRGLSPATVTFDGPRVRVNVRGETLMAPSTTKGWEPLGLRLRRRINGATVELIDDTGTKPTTKILALGDGPTSELIDFGDESQPPTVTETPLGFPRDDHPGLVPLPTGAVLVFDGNAGRPTPPEIFENGRWTKVGSAPRYGRGYHGEAVLLPDGRVLVSSDGVTGNGPRVFDQAIELFSPSYMRAARRPAITDAPAQATHRATITLKPSVDPARIASVSLLRPASITHGTDASQRFVKLKMTRAGADLTAVMPEPNSAPPGDYLLYVVDDAGVPSTGRFVRLVAQPQ